MEDTKVSSAKMNICSLELIRELHSNKTQVEGKLAMKDAVHASANVTLLFQI